jgi:dTDP-glucose 4,6-dehydratase
MCDAGSVRQLFDRYEPNAVMHLDRSIDGPSAFMQTNIRGTYTLLEAAREYIGGARNYEKGHFQFLHVSTDDVFGSLGPAGYFSECSRYAPNSPYATSKASADHLVRAWHSTYGLPVLITNCSNNFGPFQSPEKLIPLIVLSALEEKPVPVYGDGKNVRGWLYVEDHCRALRCVLAGGTIAESYNTGTRNERTNLEVVRELCLILDEIQPRQNGKSYQDLIHFVQDRPGHDRRYAIDPTRVTQEIGWAPVESFSSALKKTVKWCLGNLPWCERVREGKYQGERLGSAR